MPISYAEYSFLFSLFKQIVYQYIFTMPDNTVIRVEHAYKSFGAVRAVKDLSFEVEEATCFSLLGPNGAGKTTMMKMLYGKAMPDDNPETVIDVYGYDPRDAELQIKYFSGMVQQEDSLDENLDVLQNLKIFAKYYAIPRKIANPRIEELLEFMELTEKKKAKIKQLSGGMKRRLVIARSLLNNPELLILDEPTTGLDPQVRQLIWDRLRRLKRQGVTILLTTHYMEEAFQLADRVIIMDKGERIIEGNPKKLIEEHIEPYVLELLDKSAAAAIDQAILAQSAVPGDGNVRREESDERVIYYGWDYKILHDMTHGLDPRNYHLREINLEDLFLRATGRRINEHQ
jgi:lipooligosaccharide transport system ATP-binding protein